MTDQPKAVVSVSGKTSDEAVANLPKVVDNPDKYQAVSTECSKGKVTVTYVAKD